MVKKLSMLDDSGYEDDVDLGEGESEVIDEALDNSEGDESLIQEDLVEDAGEGDATEETTEVADQETGDEAKSDATQEQATTEATQPPVDELSKAAEGRLVALMDEREKRRKAEQELEELRRQLQAKTQPVQEQTFPDPVLDPKGYHQAVLQAQEERIIMDRVETSVELARQEYGDDVVEAARQWAAQRHNNGDLYFTNQALSQRAPMKFVVSEYQKAMKAEALLSDEDAFFEKMARERGWAPVVQTQQTQTVAKAQAQPQTRKPTLAELESVRGGSQDEPPASMLDF